MNYLQLTSLPLFVGISGEDLALIMDRVELLDLTLHPGEVFVESGTVCQGMAIVRDGIIRRCRHIESGSFVNSRKEERLISCDVEETLKPGFILEPETLFGLDLCHKSTWRAETSCKLTMISKQDIRQTLMYVPVWRINLLNMLCTKLQRAMAGNLPQASNSHEQRLLQFFLQHCSPNGLSLRVRCTNEQLAGYLGLDRSTVAQLVSSLEEKGVLSKSKRYIHIESEEKLRDFNLKRNEL